MSDRGDSMKKIITCSIVCVVMNYSSISGMLINKKKINIPKSRSDGNFCLNRMSNNDGIIEATMPQKIKGVLGDFRLDKKYGVKNYLAQYIAYNSTISSIHTEYNEFNAIEKAFQQFLNHNSFTAIQVAFNKNVIDKNYAIQALYFTYKLVMELQDWVIHQYSDDVERWVDYATFSANRNRLLTNIESEKKEIEALVDFLQQKPVDKDDKIGRIKRIFEKEKSSECGQSQKNFFGSYRIAHVHEGVLGIFDPQKQYTVQEYLKKYFDQQDDTVEWRALKKAYEHFLFYNSPYWIKDVVKVPQGQEVIESFSRKRVTEALSFTRDVACAMQRYLELSDTLCPGLHGNLYQLTDKDVQLFALLGSEVATVAQTWDGLLGNFVFSTKQSSGVRCTIQDYLCKYIARNLQIPEDAVATEATFLDIKKAFDSFVMHNHPDAILRDFENGHISRQYAKDALQFTHWVVHAFEAYLADFKDESYEQEIFGLFWIIHRMKDKASGMRFIEKGEWRSSFKE